VDRLNDGRGAAPLNDSKAGLDSKWSSTGLSPIHGAPNARSESNSSTGALGGMALSSSSSTGSAGRVSPSSSSTGVAVGSLEEVLPSGSTTSGSSSLVQQTWFIVTVSVGDGCVFLGGIFLLVPGPLRSSSPRVQPLTHRDPPKSTHRSPRKGILTGKTDRRTHR
jgi:hypothetical protein